jgi:RNA-binding protein YlmH
MTSLFVVFLLVILVPGTSGAQLAHDRLIKSIKHEADLDSVRVNSLLQCADLALSTWKPQSPDFFVSPSQAVGISKALNGVADLICTFCGGYSLSERKRLVFNRQLEGDDVFGKQFEEETDKELVETLLVGIDVRGNFLFDKAQHSEFLEAVLTCPGISKEKVGDVITLGDKGCNVLLFPDQVATLRESLKSIRSVPVEVRVLNSLAELAVAPPSRKELS